MCADHAGSSKLGNKSSLGSSVVGCLDMRSCKCACKPVLMPGIQIEAGHSQIPGQAFVEVGRASGSKLETKIDTGVSRQIIANDEGCCTQSSLEVR
ncbi:hypothetical protein PspLS_08039 [Pyricularia sp. CBS 133598]|nr:hypothetical protein PspLS_08039 [Pyricularia sp. CBS 133598]